MKPQHNGRLTYLHLLALPFLAGLCLTSPLQAEIWSDVTGKFKIDAQYEGVDGKNVVLRKPDGSTVSVPISRLSEESRTRAKQLYMMSKSEQPASSTRISPSESTYQPTNNLANIVAPAPPNIGELAPFPTNPTLQQQVDYLQTQLMAGHLEAVWYCLPDKLRSQLDTQEFRDLYRPALEGYSETNAPTEKMIAKLLEVLTVKKEFILGSSLLAAVPPDITPKLQQAYDPAIGVMYEWMSLSKGLEAIPDTTFTELVNYHLPRLGAHAKELLPLLPDGTVDGLLSQIVVVQTDATTGTITTPKQGGETETIEMTLYDGRWLPTEFADMLAANENDLLEKAKESAAEFEKIMTPESQAQTAALMNTISTPVTAALDSLLAANTQSEFDQAAMGMVQQVMMIAASMGGPNAGPPGPPAGF
ncbi:SHD1 domain-containing protein [Aporhodopirellula aestuarii]|uniref:SHD1 domain-containing protein n=1 Tax=Aporhodopirellula aestuarii TaxID=2950107 RepID=A0ABT0TZZ2_9BACT|nr:SHD1 domain-containing protein [Aporhodopirellula aestuarii]MCM2369939.1 SHD1 domain-containing protein [Aporhodopirellula aestuarii]